MGADNFIELFSYILPQTALDILRGYILYLHTLSSPFIIIAGLTFLVTTGSGAFQSIIRIMADIYGIKRYKSFKGLLYSVLAAVGVPFYFYSALLILLSGNWFLDFISDTFSVELGLFLNWSWFRYVVLFGLVFVMLFSVYRFSTPGLSAFRKIWRGILWGTGGLVTVSMIFSKFIEMSTQYSLVYGSLASIIILMVWLYLCANIVIIGGAVNYVVCIQDAECAACIQETK